MNMDAKGFQRKHDDITQKYTPLHLLTNVEEQENYAANKTGAYKNNITKHKNYMMKKESKQLDKSNQLI